MYAGVFYIQLYIDQQNDDIHDSNTIFGNKNSESLLRFIVQYTLSHSFTDSNLIKLVCLVENHLNQLPEEAKVTKS